MKKEKHVCDQPAICLYSIHYDAYILLGSLICFWEVMCPAKAASSTTASGDPGTLMTSLSCNTGSCLQPLYYLLHEINKPLNYLSPCSTISVAQG